MKNELVRIVTASLLGMAFVVTSVGGLAADFDKKAATMLFKRNECNKCHAKDRDKKGTALKKLSVELKEKEDPIGEIVKNLTTQPMVKLLDTGKEEKHTKIDTEDMGEIENLGKWILSL